jgi:predicted dehydrogenase
LEKYLQTQKLPLQCAAIIATGTEALLECLLQLTTAGCKKILIEKPAAISISELLENEQKLQPFLDTVFVAYNRRFYASVIEAEKLLSEDGGLKSMHFEFTEWAHKIGPIPKPPRVKENWFFANSTHVIDLAFFIAGQPNELKCFSKAGNLTWHKKTNFAGAGVTELGVLFSYISNWESAGRWSVELLSDKRRLYLSPLEGIQIQKKGELSRIDHLFENSLDLTYKPGLFKQVESFTSLTSNRNLTLKSHLRACKLIYAPIIGQELKS